MQGHHSALFDEKEHQSVVFAVHTIDRHSVQVTLKVVRAVTLALYAHFIWPHRSHFVDHALASRVSDCAIQEGPMAGAALGSQAETLHRADQILHDSLEIRLWRKLSLLCGFKFVARANLNYGRD